MKYINQDAVHSALCGLSAFSTTDTGRTLESETVHSAYSACDYGIMQPTWAAHLTFDAGSV